MAVSLSILERVYAQVETTFGIAPNSSGTATVSGSNCMRHTKCSIRANQAIIPTTDKTGSISATRGAPGARGCDWSIEFEARPNGAAGVVPDCDPILQATFGSAATIVTGTSATYNLSSTIKSFTLYRFRQPSTVMQQASIGSVVQELSFSFEHQANCKFRAHGTGLWAIDSKNFSSLDTIGKGGLTSFPSEPASPVTNGNPVNGLTGTATLDGNTTIQIRKADIRIATAIEVPRDRLFMGQYGSSPERDVLAVTLDLSIFDEDTSAVANLYTKALSMTPIQIILEAGSGTANRINWTLNNCLLPMPELSDDARKWASNLNGIRAYATTLTSLDEVVLKFY